MTDLVDVDKTYKESWFARRHKGAWRAPYVVEAVLNTLGKFTTVVDAGCGCGDLVQEFRRVGVDAWGIEGTPNAIPHALCGAEHLLIADLRQSIASPRRADLVMCVEVAEHIDEECADTFLDNLCAMGDLILLTAAPVGQGGHSHVNCQPYLYWIQKMADRGYEYDMRRGTLFKAWLSPHRKKGEIKVFFWNAMLFIKEGLEDA